MPVYQMTTPSGITKHIGLYDSLEAVSKLRVFKDRPALLQYVSEIPKSPAYNQRKHIVKLDINSNRWRLLWKDTSVDLLSIYTRAEIIALASHNNCTGYIKVSKRCYHESDGIIP